MHVGLDSFRASSVHKEVPFEALNAPLEQIAKVTDCMKKAPLSNTRESRLERPFVMKLRHVVDKEKKWPKFLQLEFIAHVKAENEKRKVLKTPPFDAEQAAGSFYENHLQLQPNHAFTLFDTFTQWNILIGEKSSVSAIWNIQAKYFRTKEKKRERLLTWIREKDAEKTPIEKVIEELEKVKVKEHSLHITIATALYSLATGIISQNTSLLVKTFSLKNRVLRKRRLGQPAEIEPSNEVVERIQKVVHSNMPLIQCYLEERFIGVDEIHEIIRKLFHLPLPQGAEKDQILDAVKHIEALTSKIQFMLNLPSQDRFSFSKQILDLELTKLTQCTILVDAVLSLREFMASLNTVNTSDLKLSKRQRVAALPGSRSMHSWKDRELTDLLELMQKEGKNLNPSEKQVVRRLAIKIFPKFQEKHPEFTFNKVSSRCYSLTGKYAPRDSIEFWQIAYYSSEGAAKREELVKFIQEKIRLNRPIEEIISFLCKQKVQDKPMHFNVASGFFCLAAEIIPRETAPLVMGW